MGAGSVDAFISNVTDRDLESTGIWNTKAIQSPLFISMRRDRRPYTYRAFILIRRVDLSHTNLVGTRAAMLVGGLCLYTVCLYRESTVQTRAP